MDMLAMSSRRLRGGAAASLVCALVLMVACSTTPDAPVTSLAAAKVAIDNAQRNEAGRYAVTELGSARDKLASADRAISAKKMTQAKWLAEEARAEAELASARAEVAKARAVNEEMQRSIDAMIEEMQRVGEKR
jgi:hypothetical protein